MRILWTNDGCDGPVEAVVQYRDERCSMFAHAPGVIATDEARRGVLFRMTPEQRDEEERWHRLFVAHVGAHGDCRGGVHPPPSGEHRALYAPCGERPPRGRGPRAERWDRDDAGAGRGP